MNVGQRRVLDIVHSSGRNFPTHSKNYKSHIAREGLSKKECDMSSVQSVST